MKIIEGAEYQIENTQNGVTYLSASKIQKTFEGLPIFRFSGSYFLEDGRQVHMDMRTLRYALVSPPNSKISPIEEDRKRRHEGMTTICKLSEELNTIRSGKNTDVFYTGTASDEILAQTERALEELVKLRKMLQASV